MENDIREQKPYMLISNQIKSCRTIKIRRNFICYPDNFRTGYISRCMRSNNNGSHIMVLKGFFLYNLSNLSFLHIQNWKWERSNNFFSPDLCPRVISKSWWLAWGPPFKCVNASGPNSNPCPHTNPWKTPCIHTNSAPCIIFNTSQGGHF